MRYQALIVLAVVLCIKFTRGSTKNDVTEIADGVAATRNKRATYDMMRLARGLQMLRLGKRSGSFSSFDHNIDEDDDERLRRSLNSEDDVAESAWLFPREVVFRDLYDRRDGETLSPGQIPEIEKRELPMLRLGKRESEEDAEKRSLQMLRLGKRQLSMLGLGKRSLDLVNARDHLNEKYIEQIKRSLNMLRLGKRQLEMLRLGKRQIEMLRLGKRGQDSEARFS